jgi:hypothetical protein
MLEHISTVSGPKKRAGSIPPTGIATGRDLQRRRDDQKAIKHAYQKEEPSHH